MNTSSINIEVSLDENRVPETIAWSASDTTAEKKQHAKAMLLALWDATDKTALRIDLWTKNMMIDEMADFFYQTLITMADTYGRATRYQDMVEDMKKFATDFYQKFRERQLTDSKA